MRPLVNHPHPLPLYLVRAYGRALLNGTPQPLTRPMRVLLTIDNRVHVKYGRGMPVVCGLLTRGLRRG
jgi:hypothetical protein